MRALKQRADSLARLYNDADELSLAQRLKYQPIRQPPLNSVRVPCLLPTLSRLRETNLNQAGDGRTPRPLRRLQNRINHT